MDHTSLGDRMKRYEMAEAGRRLMPLLPVLARLDGRGFSKFTKGLERPFDTRMSEAMIETTTHLVDQTNALVGYTQSDEISLLWQVSDPKQSLMFDGRIQKMTSILASMASVRFNREIDVRLPDYANRSPLFDARVWSVPSRDEAANALLWRQMDATKNSISMAARAHYSHTALMNRSGSEMQDLLMDKGVNWNDYPDHFKRGTFVQRRTVTRPFAPEELAALPPQHHAHTQPDLMIERTVVMRIDVPPFAQVTNRVEVLFEGASPQVGQSRAGISVGQSPSGTSAADEAPSS